MGGILVGLVPQLPRFELSSELVLVVFLPPLLFAAAWQTPIRDFRANLRPIGLLSIGLVLFTTVCVGLVATVVVGLPLAAALAFGAIVSPPDAIAATAILRRLDVPRRILTVLEGESLVNDATALTAYRAAVVAATSGSFVLLSAVGDFAYVAVVGLLVGLVIAGLVSWLWSRLFDPPVEITLSLLVPYAAYLTAERVHGSGVIAVVAAGLLLGFRSSRILAADARILAGGVWQILTFLVEGLAFILLGLQLPQILERLADIPPTQLVTQAAIIGAVVIVVRIIWVFPATYLPRLFSRSLRERDPYPSPRVPLVIAWAGMRGAVSLAAALALPPDFPQRDLLLFLTFAVIVVTLLGQGLTLPPLLRWLGLSERGADSGATHEEVLARTTASDVALQTIAGLRDEWPAHLPLIDNLEDRVRHRTQHVSVDGTVDPEAEQERMEHRAILAAVINAEREAIIGLRDSRAISDEILHRVERELDLEELRMEADL